MKRKNIFLYLAILIPIVMLIITALGIRHARKTVHLQYDFLYMLIKENEHPYECSLRLQAQLVSTRTDPIPSSYNAITCNQNNLFQYHVATDSSTSMSIANAKKLADQHQIQPNAPDHFSVASYCSPIFPLGWWNTDTVYDACAQQADNQKKLNIKYYTDTHERLYFYFIGWIIPNHVQK